MIRTLLHVLYGMYLTNSYGLRLKLTKDPKKKKRLRIAYSQAQLDTLGIKVKVKHSENLPNDGQYLLVSNHRSVIDPLIIELALKDTNLFGLWISKKELYNSLFFGLFVRNAGGVLIDREKSQMSGFFSEVKKGVQAGHSIYIFPEGTRNKTDEPVSKFKEGSRIIALKNRLPILPVYIEQNADEILRKSMREGIKDQEITIVIGKEISYRTKGDLETLYREEFGLL
ncbi:lysophospholipid acyltransferase family protein [Sulfurovum mangrovi]|uniref:lysophospholipid acyltransferase family protein n=1 Tax=Sulfurovum mangrovi TaxID=2893889 RepID=UPI001E4D515A|nr:lysophospholipid acyltransferase family protein [Sulfurovum mangrovi]UFH59920.1 1-acyl-sn-glycerol-3-phosphate acyltransferase [Sulfurovum mangrovi]